MSDKDRNKRGHNTKAGEQGFQKTGIKVPVAPKSSKAPRNVEADDVRYLNTPAGVWLVYKKANKEISEATFVRLMFFNTAFSTMDPSLVNKLCWEYEIGGGDAAIYNKDVDREAPAFKDFPERQEAREVAWHYAENESRIATGFAQVYIIEAGYDTSGYILKDALQAYLAKDKIPERVYKTLVKRWIEVVGNEENLADPLNFEWV